MALRLAPEGHAPIAFRERIGDLIAARLEFHNSIWDNGIENLNPPQLSAPAYGPREPATNILTIRMVFHGQARDGSR